MVAVLPVTSEMISVLIRSHLFGNDIENIFFDILLPTSQSVTIGIFYRPPNQNNFLEQISNDFIKLYTEKKEVIILGDFNINLLQNGKYILGENRNRLRNNCTSHPLLKQYKQFLTNLGLKQHIKYATRVTCETATLIDHIITNSDDKLSQSGVIDVGISDHQMIFCTRKITRRKMVTQKYIKFRSFKNYSTELYEQALKENRLPKL